MSITYASDYEDSIRHLFRLAVYSGAQPWKLSTKAGTMVMSFPLPIPPGGALSTPAATCSTYYWRAELEDGTALVQGDCLALRLPEHLHPSDTIHLSCFILNGTDGGQIYPPIALSIEQSIPAVRAALNALVVDHRSTVEMFADMIGLDLARKEAEPPIIVVTPWSAVRAEPLVLNHPSLDVMPDPLAEYDPTIHERYHLKLYPRAYTNSKPTSHASFRRLEFASTAAGVRWVADWNEGPSQPTNAEMVGALEAIQRTEGTRVTSLDIRGKPVSIKACRTAWARVLAAKSKHADEERRHAAQRMVLGPIDDGDEVGARDAE